MPARGHREPRTSLKTFVGAKIRSARKAQRLSQAELGRRIGTSRSGVSAIEAGANLTLQTVESLADALGVEPATFFSRAPRSTPSIRDSRVIVRLVELLRDEPEELVGTVERVARMIVVAFHEPGGRRRLRK